VNVVGLFAGIGGLELGLERAGHETVLLCELMEDARAVLAGARVRQGERAFDVARLEVDVTSPALRAALPATFDLLAAGFPCQDLSPAGNTAGIEGARSGLIGHVFQLLRERPLARRPTWVVLENVWNMRHLADGNAMEVVVGGLEQLGYSWAYREIDSLAFGLPQRRKRLYFVACLHGAGDPRRVLLEGNETPFVHAQIPAWHDGKACGFSWTEGNRGVGWAVDSVPTLKVGSGLDIPSPPAVILPDGRIVVPSIRDVERLQGFPRGWTEPASAVGSNNGRGRWRLVGNAVSVPVAAWIGRQLGRAAEPLALPETVQLAGEFKWPSAAWSLDPDGPRFAAAVGTWPVVGERVPLLDVLNEEEAANRPLSRKAAAGFLSRFEASRLLRRSPEHRTAFLQVLHEHVDGPA